MLLMRHLHAGAFLEQIRKNVKRRLGVDPIEVNEESQRSRYLRKVTAGLPPKDSAERIKFKGSSKTWTEVLGAR